MSSERSPAREAATEAAALLVPDGATVGLGSGRAVWRLAERLGARDGGIRAAVASERTRERALKAGLEVIELDGETVLDIALDGADEIDDRLRLIKGGGGAMLRERIVIAAARTFVVVAESEKQVQRLGTGVRLPVEVARFGWRDTRRRVSEVIEDPELRLSGDTPFMTDEGHRILDCRIPTDLDTADIDRALRAVPGVLEHGLFDGIAARALLGTPAGEVVELAAPAG